MENVVLVEHFQTFNNLNENFPNFIFLQVALLFLVFGDRLVQITLIRIFHHNTMKNKNFPLELTIRIGKVHRQMRRSMHICSYVGY